ncbi:bifunctional folylpolyglutamate synthase/dihydrofolate synthase [Fictibacillus phosphorivorans]|uniref:bifunctional folylpolyglutamate synthase/dihydrofolate synthase n=1 Tax=Fictibacillus phosphorivorans TaxID=1221500 RepID=UPI00203C8C30|nr:folylpolyglutamate synthase/dihydrofolate synthase family protein [Fictibacillus phosphorivorans]MCM3717018.1 bifunctional folylpolyglutamate synthase/dihydrofolate synthase [Fictibacillus phosphorivorans]MCM3774433.1 bifunctional folylpolyglutamate synthase/dihydrofolate synthase [Fictibacillus phosphorivorans]
MNTYEDALTWIHGLLKFGIKPGLKRVEWLLKRTGNPESKIKCIHIAGTNGKGSTVEYLRSIFNEAGYNVGTFTSPYLITFNERVSINKVPIRDQELLEYVKVIKPLVDELTETSLGSPTEFEVITVISLLYFADKQPDIVVYETGLGGLYDSTNVITPILSLISNIGYDHMGILGETIEEIAFQKAGIIKKEVPVISAVEQTEALQVIEKKAQTMNSESLSLGRDFSVHHHRSTDWGEEFEYTGQEKSNFISEISMKGFHQVKNAGLAIAAVEYLTKKNLFTIDDEKIKIGLIRANWAGRFEKVSSSPDIIIDGAHNLQGIKALKQTLEHHYKDRKIYLLFAALHDKAYQNMMKELENIIHEAYFTTFTFPRAASAEQLQAESPFVTSCAISDWSEALEVIRKKLRDEDVLIITGSLYFISEVRKSFQNME